MHELPLDTVWAWLVTREPLVAEEPVSDNAREPLIAEDAVTKTSVIQTEKTACANSHWKLYGPGWFHESHW